MNIIKNLNFQNFLKISVLLLMLFTSGLFAQAIEEIKWMAVGDLHSWFSKSGSEIEVGRTYKTNSQQDGLMWPAQFSNQDNAAAKAIWIGCTNFDDPFAGRPFSYKVVHVGPRAKDDVNEFMPQVFKMVGKFEHPLVTVDGLGATELDFLETVDEVDPTLVSDRMLVNIVNTGMGITMTRKIYAWTQQNHSNYFIYEYVFKNTGIYDNDGSTHNLTLNDVLFHWQYRYAVSKEACAYGGYWLPQSATWGANTMNDQTNPNAPPRVENGYLPARPDTPLRTLFSWNGRHDGWSTTLTNLGTNIGGPEHDDDGHLGASQFVGNVVLFADDPNNIGVDSPDQPFSTVIIGSDVPETKNNNQYNESKMTSEYVNYMDQGWPDPIHADEVGQDFATGGANAGGSSQTHTFGKYTMAPGDSVRIVIAEAVAGLNREHHYSIGEQWLDWATGGSGPYDLPDGGSTSDGDAYKNAWVFTGVDSLFQTFERAKDNYENYLTQGISIPNPPPPPLEFQVNTGGDRIILTWANNAESEPNFAGYNIYRAKFKPDTTFDLIQTINGPGVNVYEDLSPQRGFDYYYYLTAFDDGTVDPGGNILESSRFYTRTSEPAFLKRPAGTKLADIRIVPNPYNIKAREIQFGANGPGEDRIMFYNIPKVCRIKIFTERGDLVNTIEHIDGSGDQEWKQLTSSRQVVVSGLYIAHIEVMEDQYADDDPNRLVLKKGDSIIKKFVIIR